MDNRLRDAIVALSTSPHWPAYEEVVKELVSDWQEQINNPETDLGVTAVLRYARIRVLELLELPGEARDEQEEEKENGRSGETAPIG